VPSTVGSPGSGDDLNLAFKNAFNETRSFLMDLFALTENEAVTIMSTGVDFSVSQVVRAGFRRYDECWGAYRL
jgi:acetamidase/formamidase